MNSYYPKSGRVVLHVDANAFYASVEIAQDPALKGKPLVIAGNPNERKGMVIAASYECKAKGVYTTMPLWEAKKLFPDLVIKPPDHDLYRSVSARMFEVMASVAPLMEIASIDEAYLDITACADLGTPLDIASRIQHQLLQELDIPVSIGIAPNKFLAKMASDMNKPRGITVLRKRDVERVLWPLPVISAHGIGARSAEKLQESGIFTIGDLAQAEARFLESLLGVRGVRIRERVRGIDERAVDPLANVTFKSVGNTSTFSANITEERVILDKLLALSESVSRRLQKKEAVTYHVQLTLRYHDFQTATRRTTLLDPTDDVHVLFRTGAALFREHWNGDPLRLIGIMAAEVISKRELTEQLNLFTYLQADKPHLPDSGSV